MPRFSFLPGEVYSTPAAIALMEASGVHPLVLLFRHLGGDFGELDPEDWQANEDAIRDGSRIMSVYRVGDQKMWLITDGADAAGVRHTTTFLRPEEY